MKHILLPIVALLLFACLSPLFAGVEKNEDGTYTIIGKWTFWADKDFLAPSGRDNDFGEYKTILFKPSVNEFSGVKEMKQTLATFVVQARESKTPEGETILVVEQILSRAE